MKFLLVIAGLCGVALAGGSEVRNQDYGQHGSLVFGQEHNTFRGDNHRDVKDARETRDARDGGDGRVNNRKNWEWQTRYYSNNYDNRDHQDQNRLINQNQVGFIPSVDQNYYNGGYSTGYVAQQYPVGYYQQSFVPQPQPTYPAYVAQQQQYYPVSQQTYQTGYVSVDPTPVVDQNQYSYGYYNDQSGNVYQYLDNGIYNYGPSTVVSQTYSYLPISYDQIGTFTNQQGLNFHRFGSDEEAKKFNDHYRNRRGGNDHGKGNDHQGNGYGNDHQGSSFGNDHQGSGYGYDNGHATAYGVDVGSNNLRKDGGRDGKH